MSQDKLGLSASKVDNTMGWCVDVDVVVKFSPAVGDSSRRGGQFAAMSR